MILYYKRITKALIRLHECWSVPLLLADRYSCVRARVNGWNFSGLFLNSGFSDRLSLESQLFP